MGFLDIDLGDAQEPTAASEGEHLLRIVSAELKDRKAKIEGESSPGQMLVVKFSVTDEPTAKDFNHFILLPTEQDDAKTKNNRKWGLKTFCEAFEIPYGTGIDTETMPGLEGWAMLALESSEQYGEQNRVRQFMARR